MITKSQIQFIRSLQSRKTRDQLGVFVAEGPKVVEELLAMENLQVQDVFALEPWARDNIAGVVGAGGNVIEVDNETLKRISSMAQPNQVVAVFSKPWFDALSSPPAGLCIAIDGLQDPGNLGTIIRCADWFAVDTLVCGPGTADAFNAKVIQATMGSITRVQVDYVDDLAEWLMETKAAADGVYPVIAAAMEGDSIYGRAPVERGCLLIGNESRGIRAELMDLATEQITIPRRGAAESLNAAMAAGIILSHICR